MIIIQKKNISGSSSRQKNFTLYLYKSNLILLGENNFYIYDINTKNNKNYKFFEGNYQQLCGLIPGTVVYPIFLLSLNFECLLIGDKNGNLFKFDNETLVEFPKDSFLKVESYIKKFYYCQIKIHNSFI